MKIGGTILLPAAALLVASCAAEQGDLQIRASKASLAATPRPVSQRVAEAKAQLALGNVALALEGFRRAWREEPRGVDALVGMATCYDRINRFDLSRRYYEQALAEAPGDAHLLGMLADSLAAQGRHEEAARVRQEVAQRAVAIAARDPAAVVAHAALGRDVAEVLEVAKPGEAAVPGAQPMPQVAQHSVTSTLEPARAAPHLPVVTAGAPRLERLSGGEVALVTTGAPLWRSETVAVSQRSTTVRFVPLRAAPERSRVRLLNAARIDRLAARTRRWLVARGWGAIAIGNAADVRSRSVILYPTRERALAQRLSTHLGFAMAERASGDSVLVVLGKDAARLSRS